MTVAVVGGGPAGLMAAETLASAGTKVALFEQTGRVGRKFLLAGRGGLNLTHSENFDTFVSRYRNAAPQLMRALEDFTPENLRAWADGLGEGTFVGSSGRVFPTSFRAAPLLRAWLGRLHELGVEIQTHTSWTDWPLQFVDRKGQRASFDAEATVLALGGASWPRTGSDGRWTDRLPATPLRPSNVGFLVGWSDEFSRRFGGSPLKDVGLSLAGEASRGDVMISTHGIEGGAIYALSSPIRDAIERNGDATLLVDLRPDEKVADLVRRLSRRRAKDSVSSWLRGAGFAPIAISLLREVTGNAVPVDPETVARLLKAVPVVMREVLPIDRAISTAGGVPFASLDDNFMLCDRPGVVLAGEMLDWDAPTGGYLLQASFATGVAAARSALRWLEAR